VSSGPDSPGDLLASVGLSPEVDPRDWLHESVHEDAYYELLERATAEDDFGLPFRYGAAIRVDDFGALGLALKTASTLRDALLRLVRYILVLSDTLEYELHNEVGGGEFLLSRPGHRRGAQLANECALAAVTSLLRQITDSQVTPVAVSFRHPRPGSDEPHQSFFGCPVRFEDRVNALQLNTETLQTRTRLADEGLSAFLLASLDDLKQEKADRPLETQVYSAVTDSLPDGRPRKSQIARRLGMSERTLHRRLAEQGQTFQSIANHAQREAAESLLANGDSSLAEVAFLTGFSDQSAFTRAFKGWTGQTPLMFRESVSG
jgi:AraC-like DNA-binding protein